MREEKDLSSRTVDWDKLWKEHWKRDEIHRSPQFWDNRAPSFAKHVSESDYSEQFLSIMQPEKDWTVLDVGCGAGTLAIPLASRVRKVTAVDFSPVMIDLLRNECRNNRVDNITPVLGSWEDDWTDLGVGTHEVAIASRSMSVEHPRTAIEKLLTIATRRIYIAAPVGSGPFDARLFEAVGRVLHPQPDYLYLYNILDQMNVSADVTFIMTNRNKTYDSREAAYASLLWMFPDISEREEQSLKAFLAKHLVADGSHLRFDYDRTVRWAVIWWNLHNR